MDSWDTMLAHSVVPSMGFRVFGVCVVCVVALEG